MKFSRLRAVLAALMLLLTGLSDRLAAQTFQGQLTATIEDEQGAVVPGASVTLKNENTGEMRTQVTTRTGSAVFPNLLVGSYAMEVQAPGFKKYERGGLQVRSNVSVDVHARLNIGGLEETMLVVGGADLINTTSSQMEGATFNERQIVDVPVYDPTLTGDVTNFAVMAPGVGTQSGGMAGQGGVIGGNRPRNNSFVVDGLDNNEPDVTGAVAEPIQDSIAEFQLLTNQFSAEYGHSTAGQFITVTKSGTNEFHGGFWEYNINRKFMSLDNLTRAGAAENPDFEKPRFDRNRLGAQLGGPIKKDKLFFYGAYEFRNLNQEASAFSEILVPTAAGLSTLQSLAGTAGSGISPVTVGILRDTVPTAPTQSTTINVTTAAGQTVAIPVGVFTAQTPNFLREHVGQLNFDAPFEKHRFGLRLYYQRENQIDDGVLPTPQFNSNVTSLTRRVTFSMVSMPRVDLINELRAGYTHTQDDFPVELPAAPGQTDIFSNYAINDLGLEIGPEGAYPQTGSNSTLQIGNSATLIRGAHTFKGGLEFRAVKSTSQFLPRARADYAYEDLGEFLRDEVPSSLALRGVGKAEFLSDRNSFYGFVQDSWRVSPRLTLDLGIRYEVTSVAKDSGLQSLNALANVDIRGERNAAGQVIFDTLTPAHQQLLLSEFPDGQVRFEKPKADKNNFGPRLGFAYDIGGDGKSSLRGGFGIAHDIFFGNLALLQLPPQLQVETNTAIACTLSPRPDWCGVAAPSASTVGFLAGGGLPPAVNPLNAEDRTAARQGTQAYMGPEKSPETWTWALSYQRQLMSDYSVEVRYIGTRGRFLPMQRRKNAGIPNPVELPVFASEQEALGQSYVGAPTLDQHLAARATLLGAYGFLGAMTAFDPVVGSQYHGGSISLTRRVSKGLGFNVNYTLSRTVDDAENELATSLLNPRRPDDFWDIESNRGLSALHKAHKVAGMVQWEPFNAKTSNFLKGWVLNAAFLGESAQAITIQSVRDQNGDFDSTGDRAFQNMSGNRNLGTDTSFVCFSGGQTFIGATAAACGGNANVVGYAAQDPSAMWVRGREGAQRGVGVEKSKRGAFTGPGPIRLLNFGIYKNTSLGRYNVRLGASCVNCTNTPSYALGTASAIQDTDTALTNRAYVTPATTNFLKQNSWSGSLGQAPFQRVIQFELKFNF